MSETKIAGAAALVACVILTGQIITDEGVKTKGDEIDLPAEDVERYVSIGIVARKEVAEAAEAAEEKPLVRDPKGLVKG